jgi:hypothetical protein
LTFAIKSTEEIYEALDSLRNWGRRGEAMEKEEVQMKIMRETVCFPPNYSSQSLPPLEKQ